MIYTQIIDIDPQDTFISPFSYMYGDDELPIVIDSTAYDCFFSMYVETELDVEASAFDLETRKNYDIYNDSTSYVPQSSVNKIIYVKDDVSKYIHSGQMVLCEEELMNLYGIGIMDNNCPLYVIRGWNDSVIVDSTTEEYLYDTITTIYQDSTAVSTINSTANYDHELTPEENPVWLDSTSYFEATFAGMEVRVNYTNQYSNIVKHKKGSLVKLFIHKDAPAIIGPGGRVYFEWPNNTLWIGSPGRYKAIFTLVHKETGDKIHLPNASPTGHQRDLIINIRR